MNNIKIGSIVKCNDRNMFYYDMAGLVYDIRYVGEQRRPIATVGFEYETRTHEISTEFLTPIGEIEPECTALNYIPGARLKLRDHYIVHHIEISPESYQFGQDTTFYKVAVMVTLDDSISKANAKDTSIKTNPNGLYSKTLKEEIQMKTKSKIAYNPIKKVIFNDPATIVFWKDGTKTIVKRQEGAEFDPEKGLAMAICRHFLCNICGLERYDGVFKRYMPKEMKK